LATDEIWEASLLYSQVEKDFKYEALGDEAKFKNAMVYFYTGDFGWAKAQLDVLKGSTSKLISNDAMHLSLLISDNLAFDTSGEALKVFGKASLLVAQNQLVSALHILDSMESIFMVHNIMDEVYYLKYEIYFKQQAYVRGAESLEKIIKNHADDILADEALFNVAALYEFYLNDASKAQEKYKQLFTYYPGSVYVVEARNRYRKMRGDELN
jgi:tetratricopeptide (TPR) repeat protein